MKKFVALLFLFFGFIVAMHAQQNKGTQPDTISPALVLKMVNHTLTKDDSALLKQQLVKHLKIDTLY